MTSLVELPPAPDDAVDLAIIGAGVVGCAVASAAARRGLEVLLLEREERAGAGVTSRNSGVIHSGLYYPPGSLKAQSCIRGQALLYEWVTARTVPHARTGKLVVATVAAGAPALERLHQNALASGARGCVMLGAAEVATREPDLPPVAAAMLCRESGIVDAHAFTASLLADACAHEAVFAAQATVRGLEVDDGFTLVTDRGPLRARAVVNAAGLESDRIAALVGVDGFTIYPCRGDYFRLRTARPFRHLIYPVRVPGDPGLGIHLTLELDGGQRLGPDAEYVAARDDFGPAEHKHARFLEAAQRLLGPLDPAQLRYDGCGIRPKLRPPEEAEERDFVLLERPARCVHLLGIESPGLTAALDLA
ncbi:MAG: FAD-dependent oxidoreductase, partial [Myxococcales bacterium]|nr:FAD-dependent oxidoreductase [Myxococcales bacterium]